MERLILFCLLIVASANAFTYSPFRAVIAVGANENLTSPAVNFGVQAITDINGWDYNQVITNLWLPSRAWFLERFGIDFTNAIEIAPATFSNGLAIATPVGSGSTYRVTASNLDIFENVASPSRVYSVEYSVSINATYLSLNPTNYGGTYGAQGPTPILASDGFGYGIYTIAVSYISGVAVDVKERSAINNNNNVLIKNPKYDPKSPSVNTQRVGCVHNCPYAPVGHYNFTFYARWFEPNYIFFYSSPVHIRELIQYCSVDFGAGFATLFVAPDVQGFPGPGGIYRTYFQGLWQFPMNATNVAVPEFYNFNSCPICPNPGDSGSLTC